MAGTEAPVTEEVAPDFREKIKSWLFLGETVIILSEKSQFKV